MASFLRNIAERLSGTRGVPNADRVRVAAFGKHPGWNDHIEDIGLDTEMLVAAKRLIYVQGIGENIDRGTWERLRQDQRLDGFRHSFVWHRPPAVVVGRLWSSEDGRGRKSYPMVVCTHCRDLGLRWVCRCLLPRLEALESQCRSSPTAVEVRARLHAFQSDALKLVKAEGEPARPPLTGVSEALGSIAALSGLSRDDEGLMRILYHLDRGAGTGMANRGEKGNPVDRVSLRVSIPAGRAVEAAVLWLEFLSAKAGRSVDTFAFIPHGEAWLDLIVGEPAPSQLFCLRAAPGAVPLTSDIPYNIDPTFTERVKGLLTS